MYYYSYGHFLYWHEVLLCGELKCCSFGNLFSEFIANSYHFIITSKFFTLVSWLYYVCCYSLCDWIYERGLIHASTISILRICNTACIWVTPLKFGSKTFLSWYLYERKKLSSLLTMKLCFFKVAKLDGCTRPLFPQIMIHLRRNFPG